jgi:hypothetical protein
LIDLEVITLAEAKLQLRIAADNTYHDPDIEMKRKQATAIILRYYKVDLADEVTIPPDWIVPDSSPAQYVVPDDVKAWVLIALSEMFENREASISDVLAERLRYLIPRLPTMA